MNSSSNPVFGDKAIKNAVGHMEKAGHMTIAGTLNKAFFLLMLVFISAGISWFITDQNPAVAGILVLISLVVSFVSILVIIFKQVSPALSVVYSIAQGVMIGSISFLLAEAYSGIVGQALLLTGSITLGMYALYASRLIVVTEKLRAGIIVATVGVLLFYVSSWIIGLFSESFRDFINTGQVNLIISGIIVLVATLNLLLDFDFIEQGEKRKYPKDFEWYGAFGLTVTLIWLYVSILRFLAASRD